MDGPHKCSGACKCYPIMGRRGFGFGGMSSPSEGLSSPLSQWGDAGLESAGSHIQHQTDDGVGSVQSE